MPQVTGFVGVYHAEGTLWGELSYWVGARLGRTHCSLCDITHGTFRRKATWTSCAQSLPVAFTTYHLDDQPDDVRAASHAMTPCVLARTDDDRLVMVATPGDLEACAGDPSALVASLERGCAGAGVRWPG
jgi:hypothetical protein